MLHIVPYSPFCHHAFKHCSQTLQAGDHLLFIQDGVLICQEHNALLPLIAPLQQANIHLYALTPDIEARGIACSQLFTQIDFLTFVDLCEQCPKIVTWQ